MIVTRITFSAIHGACNEIYKLFGMQITKSFCKAMFTIAQFLSEVDVDIGNNQSLFNKWTLSMLASMLMSSALLEEGGQ